MKSSFAVALAATVFIGVVYGVQAQSPTQGGVDSKLEVKKVVIKDGKEVLEAGGTARPGDILQYSSIYVNKSKAPVTKLEATLPIPPSTELILDSISPAGARASTDGLSFAPVPLMRKLKLPDGKESLQAVPARDYRALRWTAAEVPGEKSATFLARVKVLQDAASSASATK